MRAGKLNCRITIQRKTAGEDEWGNPLPQGWEDIASVWADFRHKSGAETIRADAEISTVRASVRIRWRTDIDAGMRVRVNGAYYDIEAVLADMAKREYVDIVCKRVT